MIIPKQIKSEPLQSGEPLNYNHAVQPVASLHLNLKERRHAENSSWSRRRWGSGWLGR